jgi:o-succinylbenzoate synthase
MIAVDTVYHPLNFGVPVRTSRDLLRSKPTWYIRLTDTTSGKFGLGEVSIIEGLSVESSKEIEVELHALRTGRKPPNPELFLHLPALRFGLEVAQASLHEEDAFRLFNSPFTLGKAAIPINGLVWMNTSPLMLNEAREKILEGFKCMKFKVGALEFEEELKLLESIRNEFGDSIEIRLDANGGFTDRNPLEKLKTLSAFKIHSIEQPIKAGRISEMADLVQQSPIPIALDEELIGLDNFESKQELISAIQAPYIILKPSLLGGWKACDEWVELIEANGGSWWATSALESNIGLNGFQQKRTRFHKVWVPENYTPTTLTRH